jgi:hypothetical protein
MQKPSRIGQKVPAMKSALALIPGSSASSLRFRPLGVDPSFERMPNTRHLSLLHWQRVASGDLRSAPDDD